jgi:hypothetical protein
MARWCLRTSEENSTKLASPLTSRLADRLSVSSLQSSGRIGKFTCALTPPGAGATCPGGRDWGAANLPFRTTTEPYPRKGEVHELRIVISERRVEISVASPLLEALVEFNPSELPRKIAVAEAAIAKRKSELNGGGNPSEKIALDGAERSLAALKIVKE